VSQTFFEKLWDQHVIAHLGQDTYLLQIDRLLMHELSGAQPLRALEAAGRRPDSPRQVFAMIDHLVATQPDRGIDDVGPSGGAQMIRDTRILSKHYGLTFFDTDDARQGIVHVVGPEQGIVQPGMTVVCGDSHTSTLGGIGVLAWGVGTSEVEHVLATQTIVQAKPKTMLVRFEGRLGTYVSPKDMVLHLIASIGIEAGIGYAVEFGGSVMRDMPVEGRLTICNMSIEFQAKYGFVAPDDITIDYLRGRAFSPVFEHWDAAVAYWRGLRSDSGSRYEREVVIDMTDVAPQVTWGTNPAHACAIDSVVPQPRSFIDPVERESVERALAYMQLEPGAKLQGTKIDVAYIGSCTNGRLSDLRAAADVLKGRRIAPHVLGICIPGSTVVKRAAEEEGLDLIFKAAGFQWHESGCGMCAAGGAHVLAGKRVIGTTNRNFEGRQGPGTRTHLASPVTVAQSAICGEIADPRVN